jgi:hypothetical protein
MVRMGVPLRPMLVGAIVAAQRGADRGLDTLTDTPAATQSARHAADGVDEALRMTALARVRATADAANEPGSSVIHVCAVPNRDEAAGETIACCGLCSSCAHMPINAICMLAAAEAGAGENILVLTPADMRLDCRWLANCLGLPRNRLRLATRAECIARFHAAPGEIPPIPLELSTRVLAVASLAAPNALLASAGDSAWRLCIGRPRQTLPIVSGSGSFEWLPDPAQATRSLDDAIDQVCATADSSKAHRMPSSGRIGLRLGFVRTRTRSEYPAANALLIQLRLRPQCPMQSGAAC